MNQKENKQAFYVVVTTWAVVMGFIVYLATTRIKTRVKAPHNHTENCVMSQDSLESLIEIR
jgi:hypothetical protein